MEYLIVFILTFNTAVLYYTSWQIVDYLRWKRTFVENKNV